MLQELRYDLRGHFAFFSDCRNDLGGLFLPSDGESKTDADPIAREAIQPLERVDGRVELTGDARERVALADAIRER